jgi:molybdenum cofactor cytidylyltransferase
MVSAVVLAAGESRRMGKPKQLLDWQGENLLAHVLGQLRASEVDDVILVLGHEAERIRESIRPFKKMRIVSNPDYPQGMSTSILCGLQALPKNADAFLIVLADLPGITSNLVNHLIRAFHRNRPRKDIIVPTYRGTRGHPVLFAARYILESLEIEGDMGCRPILAKHPEQVFEIEVDQAAVLLDIDTPEDYRRHRHGGKP